MPHEPSLPVAGIDVAKEKLDVFVDTVKQRFCIPNREEEIDALATRLRQLQVRLVVIESTGRYHRRVAAALLQAGVESTVVNPQRVREFARSTGTLEKSDAIDATILARFGRLLDPRPNRIEPQNQMLLRDLVSRRRALVQHRVAEKNRAHDTLPTFAARQSKQLLRLLDQQIEDLDREIARLIEADDDWQNKSRIIDSIPGIGPDGANQLIADLPELGKLNRQQIAKLTGLAPILRDSGLYRGQRKIAGGRRDVRCLLYMLAHNARRLLPTLRRLLRSPHRHQTPQSRHDRLHAQAADHPQSNDQNTNLLEPTTHHHKGLTMNTAAPW